MSNSSYYDSSTRFFTRPGSRNTASVLDAVAKRAADLSVRKVLVASRSGKTALAALKKLGPDIRIIAVTYVTGFSRPDFQELREERRRKLESAGVSVLTCQHAFGGVGRAVRTRLATYQVDEILGYTLRIFGQGTKVAVEISLMAADAGLVRTDEDIIAIGGTETGADTALLVRPANSSRFFDFKVKEIICKPAEF